VAEDLEGEGCSRAYPSSHWWRRLGRRLCLLLRFFYIISNVSSTGGNGEVRKGFSLPNPN